VKQSDIASLILITAIGFTIAFIIGNAVFNTPESRSTEVEVVNGYNTEIVTPSSDIFNADSINPTEDIEINPSDTDNPFSL